MLTVASQKKKKKLHEAQIYKAAMMMVKYLRGNQYQ